jgi:hypothetical protein
MKVLNLLVGVAAAVALTACDSHQKNVQDAQKDLVETQQEAQKDVAQAQGNAVQDINSTKESAAKDVQDAQKKLVEEQRDAAKDSSSSSSTSIMDNKDNKPAVTAEQCARFATNKQVKPEDKALYDACSKINEKSYR